MSEKLFKIQMKDIFDELKAENDRLLTQLLFAQKCIQLLESYRNCLNSFLNNFNNENNDNKENKTIFNNLENQYKCLSSDESMKNIFKSNLTSNSYELTDKVVDEVIDEVKQRNNDNNDFDEENVKSFDSNELKTKGKVSENLSLTSKKKTNLKTKFCSHANCDYKTKMKTSMESHINKVHNNCKPYECNKCKKTFTGKHNLISHKRFVHSLNKYSCDWSGCHFVTHTQQYLKNHKIRHTGDKPFKCNYNGCEGSYYTISSLKVHQRRAHQNWRPYPCHWPGCDSTFKTTEHRKLHLRVHTGEKPFKCDWPGCQTSFAQKHALLKHQDIHNEVRNHVCLQCDKKFRRNYHLKVHLMTHEKDRQFKCHFTDCKRTFTQKSTLNRHLKTH